MVGPAAGHPEIGSRKNAKEISARAELDAVMARIARLNACIEAEVGSVRWPTESWHCARAERVPVDRAPAEDLDPRIVPVVVVHRICPSILLAPADGVDSRRRSSMVAELLTNMRRADVGRSADESFGFQIMPRVYFGYSLNIK